MHEVPEMNRRFRAVWAYSMLDLPKFAARLSLTPTQAKNMTRRGRPTQVSDELLERAIEEFKFPGSFTKERTELEMRLNEIESTLDIVTAVLTSREGGQQSREALAKLRALAEQQRQREQTELDQRRARRRTG